jgi:hypothetical protein
MKQIFALVVLGITMLPANTGHAETISLSCLWMGAGGQRLIINVDFAASRVTDASVGEAVPS